MSDWVPLRERKQKNRVDAGYFLSKQEEEEGHYRDRHRGKESEVDGACHQNREIKGRIIGKGIKGGAF